MQTTIGAMITLSGNIRTSGGVTLVNKLPDLV
jgi:hypothetical protein